MTEPLIADHTRYSEWDAAYVLGALSPADRHEFEKHLETCDRCRASITELSALPGLLGRLTPAQGMAVLDDEPAEPGPAPDLIARITSLDQRRRRRRFRLIGGLAAAALVVAATAVAVPLVVQANQTPGISVELASTTSAPISAVVQLHSVRWGTRIDMACTYGTAGDSDSGKSWDYALWVVDHDGQSSELSSWKAIDGSTAHLEAGTSLTTDEIATVQIRSTSGKVVATSALQ
jgi:anti-sigma-K factor RskA